MHRDAAGLKVLWVFTLIIGLLLAASFVISISLSSQPVTTQQWMILLLGSIKIIGAAIGLWLFNRSE